MGWQTVVTSFAFCEYECGVVMSDTRYMCKKCMFTLLQQGMRCFCELF